MIKALLLKPYPDLSLSEVEVTPASIAGLIGDDLELVRVPGLEHGVGAYCDELGKAKALAPSLPLVGDVVLGPVLFFAYGPDGEERSMTDEQVAGVRELVSSAHRRAFWDRRSR